MERRVLKAVLDRRVHAAVLALCAFIATVALAVLGSAEGLPWGMAAVLTILVGIFQLASAWLIRSVGRADPTLARASVRRLLRYARRAAQAEDAVQLAFETGTATDRRQALGVVSVQLSHLQEGFLDAVDDWQEFHGDALKELMEDGDDTTD